ncbi:hypothetical protein NMY22_g7775 [Coprinellus aureogranulatus]|nr:hypothetical protein NMY22_g7775 [Coprinellus aureogranulatus]
MKALFEAIQDMQHGLATGIALANEGMTSKEASTAVHHCIYCRSIMQVQIADRIPPLLFTQPGMSSTDASGGGSVHIFAGAHHQAIESADIRGAGRDMYNAPTMILNITVPAHVPSHSGISTTGSPSQQSYLLSSMLASFGRAASSAVSRLANASSYENQYPQPNEQAGIGATLKCVEEIEESLRRLKAVLGVFVDPAVSPTNPAPISVAKGHGNCSRDVQEEIDRQSRILTYPNDRKLAAIQSRDESQPP